MKKARVAAMEILEAALRNLDEIGGSNWSAVFGGILRLVCGEGAAVTISGHLGGLGLQLDEATISTLLDGVEPDEAGYKFRSVAIVRLANSGPRKVLLATDDDRTFVDAEGREFLDIGGALQQANHVYSIEYP